MTRFAIIADDLSSATDCGAQVVRSGLSVVVPLGSYSLPAQTRTVDVSSVDTDSRSLPPEQAYARVRTAAEQLVAAGVTHFYKSVDSTLRGNLGAEIEAALDVVQADCAIVAPAFPKYGRTTVDGVQYLHGRPLHETEFGTDPTAPVKDADILSRLAEGSRRKAGRVKLEEVRAGRMELENVIRKLLAENVELIVVDIAEQDDLQKLCLSFSNSELRIVWVGSTGMAEFVPLAWNVATASTESTPESQIDPRPALALVGSASETTREQVAYAETNRGAHLIHLDPACLIQNRPTAQDELKRVREKLQSSLESGHDVALVVRASREEIATTQQLGATLHLSPAQVAQRIVDGMAQVAATLVREGQISGIVATGGDTANALCNTLGVHALEILGEVEAGIPIMRILGEVSLPLVTKAGGFGSPAAMADALEKVKEYA